MITAWHDAIIAISRDVTPYASKWVNDDLQGRSHMVGIAMTLGVRRLRAVGAPGKKLADRVYHRIFRTLDYGLREDGVSDSSIARKIRALGSELVALARGLERRLNDDRPGDIESFLVNNGVCTQARAANLTNWILIWQDQLLKLDDEDVIRPSAIKSIGKLA